MKYELFTSDFTCEHFYELLIFPLKFSQILKPSKWQFSSFHLFFESINLNAPTAS